MIYTKTSCFRRRILPKLTVSMLAIMVLATLSACTSQYGKLLRSSEISEAFETNQILPDHIYYFYGFRSIPYAIIGISRNYTLRSPAWKKIELTQPLLSQLIYGMQSVYSPVPQGARILGPNGEQLGIWYSPEQWTAVRLEKENQIVVVPPQPPELKGIR